MRRTNDRTEAGLVLLTDNSEHGRHRLVHGLNFDHGCVVDGDLLEGQRVDFPIIQHVHHLAGMQADVIFVPDHRDVVVGEFHTELCCFTFLHRHIFDRFDKL